MPFQTAVQLNLISHDCSTQHDSMGTQPREITLDVGIKRKCKADMVALMLWGKQNSPNGGTAGGI